MIGAKMMLYAAAVRAVDFDILNAPAPLYRDPVFDGAADPTVVYDKLRQEWFIFYTQRRASDSKLLNRSWCFGTDIGLAVSQDLGITWKYQGPVRGLKFEGGTNTFWAPDVFRAPDGTWHLFVTYIKGVIAKWGGAQKVAHYTAKSLYGPWRFSGLVPGLTNVLDPDVIQLPDGRFKMFFKDIRNRGQTGAALSTDLSAWRRLSRMETDGMMLMPHEAPNVFFWKGYYWLLIDPMSAAGIFVLRSSDAATWVRQKEPLLHWGGVRPLDNVDGNHVDVVTSLGGVVDKALIFYFVHPGRPCCQENRNSLKFRMSVLQVAELEFVVGADGEGRLKCRRDRYVQWNRQKRRRNKHREALAQQRR